MAVNKKLMARKACAAAVMAACAGSALAIEIDTESGWKGSLNTKVSVGANWRAQDPEKALISAKMAGYTGDYDNLYKYNGYYSYVVADRNPSLTYNAQGNPGGVGPSTVAAGFADVGNLNYAKNDMYSATAKVLTELTLSKGDVAFLIRGKAWYDYAAHNKNVPYGNRASWVNDGNGSGPADGPTWDRPLRDDGAPKLAQYDGVYLMDAYASYSFDVVDMPAQVRLGRQVVNWGEGIFTRGLSQLAPLDLTAMRRAGTELKEILLPTLAVTGNIGLPGGMSLEGVYQLKWEPSVAEYCGSFWNGGFGTIGPNPGACDTFLPIGGNPNTFNLNGAPAQVLVKQARGHTPNDAGQWGLAFRFPVEMIDTEFSLYAMDVASTLPVLRATAQWSTAAKRATYKAAGGFMDPTISLDYLDKIRVYGISAATNIAGVSVGAELSYQKDVPVNWNTKDLEGALIQGPNSPISARVWQENKYTANNSIVQINAYDRFDKTHFIVNGVAMLGDFAKMVDATNATLIAEAGFEWNNVPDYNHPGATRYGRSGSGQANFFDGNGGLLNANGVGGAATADRCIGANGFQAQACKNEGFVTDYSWGYRVRGAVTWSQVFGTSWSATPSVFFSHDVEGVSMDGQYQEGRKTVALGLEFDLNKEHTVGFGYTNLMGKWNTMRDHDNYSMSYTYSF